MKIRGGHDKTNKGKSKRQDRSEKTNGKETQTSCAINAIFQVLLLPPPAKKTQQTYPDEGLSAYQAD
jgi:hypothetical protein